MRILSWNVNGLRAVGKNGFFEWLEREAPDVLCLQETKCRPDQLPDDLVGLSWLRPFGYESFWHSAEKPGYSGVAIYARVKPRLVGEGIGVRAIDAEGRVLTAAFDDCVVVNAYFPNSQRDHARLGYKLEFCREIFRHCEKLRRAGPGVVLCGDYNIAHREIDLRNPRSNTDNAGFLPEERAWMDEFTGAGWVDTFRRAHPGEPGHYSWWSYRPGVRERNIGWRLDYHCVNVEAAGAVRRAWILPEVRGSDHCPVGLELG